MNYKIKLKINKSDNIFQTYNSARKNKILTIGPHSYVEQIQIDIGIEERSHVLIGKFCSISLDVVFEIGQNHPIYSASTYPFRAIPPLAPGIIDNPYTLDNHYHIILGNDVWVGRGAMFLSGVRVGNGAIIGAGAVVRKDVPPYAIVIGNPARIVKYRFPKKTIDQFQRIKWWNWTFEKILEHIDEMDNGEVFAERYDTEPPETQTDATDTLKKLRAKGKDIFSYTIDPKDTKPTWEGVVDQYLFNFNKYTEAVLVLRALSGSEEILRQIKEKLSSSRDNALHPEVFLYNDDDITSMELMRYTDVYLVGASPHHIYDMNWVDNFGIMVRSAFDFDRDLFAPKNVRI